MVGVVQKEIKIFNLSNGIEETIDFATEYPIIKPLSVLINTFSEGVLSDKVIDKIECYCSLPICLVFSFEWDKRDIFFASITRCAIPPTQKEGVIYIPFYVSTFQKTFEEYFNGFRRLIFRIYPKNIGEVHLYLTYEKDVIREIGIKND